MNELNKCPFCGGVPSYEEPYSTTDWTFSGAIRCNDCSVKMTLSNDESKSLRIGYGYLDTARINRIRDILFTKWNRRA